MSAMTAAGVGAQLAARLERGAQALLIFAAGVTDAEWQTPVPGDGRTIGLVVHHVASVYPIEVELARRVACGEPVRDLTMHDIHLMNARHAREHARPGRDETLTLLAGNAAAAAAAIRAMSDSELAVAAPVSLYSGAEVTSQFVLEDHAVRHSIHHLARLRAALGR
jgi:hypothetical protein